MNGLLAMLGTIAIGALYVFQPMAKRYRYRKVVTCPETGQPAQVLVDASARHGEKPVRIGNCSLWPKRKGCTQSCVA
ncbi:MAG TPA: hypothetical protein VNL14_12100 [Candidatus Acidoferrales bacterium]|nr:hypothetical protein [Candidatus Acidoferrales bacterium]